MVHVGGSGSLAHRLDVTPDVVYALATMYLATSIRAEAALFLFTFFIVVPSIAAAIGYAAWKGRPRNFSREMYWTAFVAAMAVSLFLFVYSQRMHADVRTWHYLLQIACFGGGAFFFGIAGGCMVGIFTYRHPPGNHPTG